MEQVKTTSGADVRIDRGMYAAGAISRTPHRDLAAKVVRSTKDVQVAERTYEDGEWPVTFAQAARDIVRADLEDTAASLRHGLAGASRHAIRERPFTDILPDGLGQLTKAGVDDTADEFGGLVRRLEAHLPEDDPLRVAYVPVLVRQIQEWKDARTALVDARTAHDILRQHRDNALRAWDATIVEVYGLMVARVGKLPAERYFKRTKARKVVVAPVVVADPDTAGLAGPPVPEVSSPDVILASARH